MGCDIHLCVEENINGVWTSADQWKDGRVIREVYDDRNYNLFAILANVRNGYGFAGVKTGEGFNPISSARGLPDDASEEVSKYAHDWGADGHSHSFFTIREILDYDWNQKSSICGWVDVENFRIWKNRGHPGSWCGDVTGHNIKHVDVAEMERLAGGDKTDAELYGYHCHVEWTKYYHECLGTFSKAVFCSLHKNKPEDVRFVFWFDN